MVKWIFKLKLLSLPFREVVEGYYEVITSHIITSSQRQVIKLRYWSIRKSSAVVSTLQAAGLFPLKPTSVEIFQVNIGKMCNQTCRHCHVDAEADRKGNHDTRNDAVCAWRCLLPTHPSPQLILPVVLLN